MPAWCCTGWLSRPITTSWGNTAHLRPLSMHNTDLFFLGYELLWCDAESFLMHPEGLTRYITNYTMLNWGVLPKLWQNWILVWFRTWMVNIKGFVKQIPCEDGKLSICCLWTLPSADTPTFSEKFETENSVYICLKDYIFLSTSVERGSLYVFTEVDLSCKVSDREPLSPVFKQNTKQ